MFPVLKINKKTQTTQANKATRQQGNGPARQTWSPRRLATRMHTTRARLRPRPGCPSCRGRQIPRNWTTYRLWRASFFSCVLCGLVAERAR